MTAEVVRRIRLPADHTSPGAARAAVRTVAAEAGMTDVLDEALLLTTELSTNSVVHAGTEFDVEISADGDSLTVCVMDYRSGPLTDHRWGNHRTALGRGELDERGRGLLLVDQLASTWGTVHHADGKGVWFRLDRTDPVGVPTGGWRSRVRPGTGPARPPESIMHAGTPGSVALGAGSPSLVASVQTAVGDAQPTPQPVTAPESDAEARPVAEAPPAPGPAAPSAFRPAQPYGLSPDTLAALTLPSAALTNSAAFGEVAEDLLRRLCRVVGARGGAVLLDEGDGRGPWTAAGFGVPTLGGPRVPLPLRRPWRGELTLAPADAPYAEVLAESTAERIALFVENERLRRSDTERRSWLTYLAEVSELLAQSLDVDLTMALIPQLVVPRLGEWCAVHAAEEGDLRLAAVTHADESAVPALLETLPAAQPQLYEALNSGAVVPLTAPVEGLCVALVARGLQLGALSVGRTPDRWQGPEEVAVVEDIARRAALAMDNARIHAERRSVAEALQRSLLPPRLPEVSGLDFGAEYVPTGDGVDVGGDFYDVLQLPDQRWLVVVGDVSGKGVQAAAVTGLVRDVTRVLIRDGRPFPDALARLNETLVERGGGRFCTLALAAVGPASAGRLEVSLYLAGHDQPVLLHADGSTSLVGSCGTALGLLTAISSPLSSFSLGPGDTLVFYTDGVTERRRGVELFGVERLRREAAAVAGFPAGIVAARLRAATLGFSVEVPRDDIAILALRNDRPVG